MIRGVHAMFYSSEADALRDFLRDKLKLPFSDTGGGWLIFDLPEGDIGCHPTDQHPGSPPSGTHDVSFYCDDVQATRAELEGRGVSFVDTIEDHGYGLVTHFVMPGNVKVQLYQPRYQKRVGAHGAKAKVAPAKKAPARTRVKAKVKAAAKRVKAVAKRGKPKARGKTKRASRR